MPIVNFTGPYALSERQVELYTHRCRIYRTTPANTTTGDATEAHDPRWDNVPCYRNRRPSIYVDTPSGRIEHDIFGTNDIWQVPEQIGTDIYDGDYILNLTLTPEGQPAIDYGAVWIVRGEATTQTRSGERDAGLCSVITSVVPVNDVPSDIAI